MSTAVHDIPEPGLGKVHAPLGWFCQSNLREVMSGTQDPMATDVDQPECRIWDIYEHFKGAKFVRTN